MYCVSRVLFVWVFVVVALLILSEGWARDLMLKIEIKAQGEMVTPT